MSTDTAAKPMDAAERAQAMAFECSHAVPEPGTTHWDKQQSCLQKHLRQAEQAARLDEREKQAEWLAERGFLVPDEKTAEEISWHVLRYLNVAPEKKYARAVECALRDGAKEVLKRVALKAKA